MKKLFLCLMLLMISMMFITDQSLIAQEPRSPEWNNARQIWLNDHPVCAICGSEKDRQVHHVLIFSRHPEKELDQTNYITVCVSKYWGLNCHLVIHGGNFRLENPWAREDAVKLNIIMNPKYIKENGDSELTQYIKDMNKRIKKYNCDTYQFRCSKL